jgi:hypothetical protein
MGYGLDGRGSILGRGKLFLFSTVFSQALKSAVFYPMDTVGCLPEDKAVGA